jgi:hypothetical protein
MKTTLQKINKWSPLILIGAVLLWFLYGAVTGQLANPNTMAVAKVVSVEPYTYYKQVPTKLAYYTFTVKGKVYEGKYNTRNLAFLETLDSTEGHYFPVMYYDKDPTTSDLLVLQKDFSLYSLPFPDSLKWVCRYLRCE